VMNTGIPHTRDAIAGLVHYCSVVDLKVRQ
jgi:hypothetical protein